VNAGSLQASQLMSLVTATMLEMVTTTSSETAGVLDGAKMATQELEQVKKVKEEFAVSINIQDTQSLNNDVTD
jgi:hypothetical protein